MEQDWLREIMRLSGVSEDEPDESEEQEPMIFGAPTVSLSPAQLALMQAEDMTYALIEEQEELREEAAEGVNKA